MFSKKVTIYLILLFFSVFFVSIFLMKGEGVYILNFFDNVSSENMLACKDCNIILITATNVRYDHLSQNGYFRETSPNLDALASESLVFDNAFSQSSWTLPEGISLYTSLYPYQHGIMNRFSGAALLQSDRTFIDILNENEYITAAFTGGFDYDPLFGLTNRFGVREECKGDSDSATSGYGEFPCTISKATNWLKNNSDEKFFLHIQGFDAHCPFSQKGGYIYDKEYDGSVDYSRCLWTFDKSEPEFIDGKPYYRVYSAAKEGEGRESTLLGEDDIKHLVALYDESILEIDALIGSFLEEIKELGLNDNTIIIFTSEHGDMFGKYGRFMRGGPLRGTFYDDVLHTPLLIKHPKIVSARIDGLVEHIDIVPTLLDFLSIPKNPSFEGKSLIPLILKNEEVHEYVFAGSEYNPGDDNNYFTQKTSLEAIRSKEWKLIKESILSSDSQVPVFEFYDIVNDKEELYNLADKGGDIFEDLKERLSDWSNRVRENR